MTDKPLPIQTVARLREAFSESDLPFKVDLIDGAESPESFHKIIAENYEVI